MTINQHMTPFEIVLASRNEKKSREISELLEPFDVHVVSVRNFDNVPDVIEDGDTFAANAAKKASQTATVLDKWVIGEDSGLRVDALDGRPGVYSARYSGENATDESNNAKLLEELADVPTEKRGAEYVCHVALSDPSGEIKLSVESTCRGRISPVACGTNGFGYDPYFLIPEYHATFGELPSIVKRQLSHRARAFFRFIPQLLRLLDSTRSDD